MIKISACVIVKNEAKNIQSWMAHLKGLADEMIVVDTGSADATAALAEAGGARVFHFPWQGDFATAKNYALDQAAGEWIIFLDADEYFPSRAAAILREKVRHYHPNRRIIGLICQLKNIDTDQRNRLIGITCQVRVFRHLDSLRYTGRVHEALQDNSAQAGRHTMQLVPELEIYHTGYSQHIVREKLQRNLEILLQEVEQKGEQPQLYLYFMDCYYGLGDYEQAVSYARRAIDSGIKYIGADGNAHEILISALTALHRPMAEILTAVDEAMAAWPKAQSFPLMKGLLYWDQKDYLAAEKYLRLGLEMKQEVQEASVASLTDSAERLWPGVYLCLGRLAQLRADENAAVTCFVEGLKAYPYEEALFSSLYACIAKQPPAEIISFLNAFYDRTADAGFLAQVLRENHAGQVYLYYARLAGEATDTPAAYMAAGRCDAAAVAWAEELDTLYRLGVWSSLELKLPEQTAFSVLLPLDYQEAWKRLAQETSAPAAACTERQQELTASIRRMREQLRQVPETNEIAALTAKAAGLFEKGEVVPAIRLLLEAYKQQPEEPELAYALACLLQLDGQKEQARRVLLSSKNTNDAMRELWAELRSDSDKPLVSILIPTYNRPELFELTLRSALAQTYTNVEIIVCDNSTDDRTEQLMKKYQQNLRLVYVRNREAKTKAENFQPFERLAKGEFLQWCMDDDILVKEKLDKMVACFQAHPQLTMVTSERGTIDMEGRITGRMYYHLFPGPDEYGIVSGEEAGRKALMELSNYMGEPSAVLFRRRDLQHHYWNADCRGYKVLSDVVMWLELFEKGAMAYFHEPLSYYRRHSSQEGVQPDVLVLSRLEWFRLTREYYERKVFLHTLEDYQWSLKSLQADSPAMQPLQPLVSTQRWQQYEDCLKEAEHVLTEQEQ